MDTEQLTARLRGVVDGVAPRPGFADTVTHGARRRRTRRRLGLGALSLVVLTVAGVGAAGLPRPDDGRTVDEVGPANANAERWLAHPTSGPLAGDRAVLDAAVDAWRAHLPNSPNGLGESVRGEPRVYWAGDTPAGRAAVVVQPSPDRGGTALGLVDLDHGPRVLTDAWAFAGPGGVGFQFGPDDRTLLVLDVGRPLTVSAAPLRAEDGTVTRDWAPLPTTDGVAVVELPAGTEPAAVRVTAGSSRLGAATPSGNRIMLLPAGRAALGFDQQSKYRTERRLDWPDGVIQLSGDRPPPRDLESLLFEAGLLDPLVRLSAGGLWTVALTLPDGRPAWVTEWQEDSSASRLVLVTGDGADRTVRDGGPVDPAAVPAVRLRLPDGQGWVVAQHGATLRHRGAPIDGVPAPWLDAGRDAALLPATTTEVEVTTPGGTPVTLPLTP